jgi:hypothetical protein
VVSSAAAPVLMVGGWTLAAGLQQPQSYSQLADTVSALAAPGATDRWVMTVTFLVVGACDAITGLALRPARTWAADPDVRGRGGHGGRAGRPGGARLRRRAGIVAAGSGRVLPGRRQHGHHA